MILIGSRALNYYTSLNRVLHDYDLIMTLEEYEIFDALHSKFKVKETDYSIIYDFNGEIYEVRNPKTLDETDNILLGCKQYHILLPIGYNVWLCPLQYLYEIKKATALHIPEPKHQHDLTVMENTWQLYADTGFFKLREQEIKERVSKSSKVKYDFFHKYKIPEYILHDRIHEMFADLLDLKIPTYQRITVAETDISEECFNKLTHEHKISLMVEEVLVLNMERWYIPRNVEDGINYRLIGIFYNNNEAMPTYKILKHVCCTGLKTEKDFIINFSRNSFFEIEKEWIKAKETIKNKGGFPKYFYDEIFQIRNKYKQGTKVGII